MKQLCKVRKNITSELCAQKFLVEHFTIHELFYCLSCATDIYRNVVLFGACASAQIYVHGSSL